MVSFRRKRRYNIIRNYHINGRRSDVLTFKMGWDGSVFPSDPQGKEVRPMLTVELFLAVLSFGLASFMAGIALSEYCQKKHK